MSPIELRTEDLHATVSAHGGTLLSLDARRDGERLPILRTAPSGGTIRALHSACFPLVPFGNRVRGNRFECAGRQYTLAPNQPWDEHYLHGDGWLGEWTVAQSTADAATLVYEHAENAATPYAYRATQRFALNGNVLTMTLSVTNLGAALPFGLGWHPYFVLEPDTLLQAPATSYWTECEQYLPGDEAPVPDALDFRTAAPLPRRWVNNGFAGWNGAARIAWPGRGLELSIEAPGAGYYFLFVSDTQFDPNYHHDYFCFEPMTHAADSHASPKPRGLVTLATGADMALTMRLAVSNFAGARR
ncbi:aldose 1-epimerase [Paraburkholderia caffeinilytica]|uniref:aldose 1-epimerase n=1 Tax=Paraburkholderia caffeinilytica TaxID=1761016 RepID=UPI0038B8237A